MMIAEKIKRFLKFSKTVTVEDKRDKPLKPIDYPAKVLFIDDDLFAENCYQEDFIFLNFNREVKENLIEFQFVSNLFEASAQIQLDPPDLIISELYLPYCQLIGGEEIAPTDYYLKSRSHYGLNIFEILDNFDLDFKIPVIFFSNLVCGSEYIEKAFELGAIVCLEKSMGDDDLKLTIKKALQI
ncbi:MAG: hypothetical protein HC764_08480 [Pleurocapsa sp. CRU_1_2]|nr:hypothetical protein [Pleurocapsa sp. CRU_1_2]